MKQLTSIEQYNSIVERYRRTGCLSNDYLQARAAGLIAHGTLLAECNGDNAYLLEAKDNCYRLYYFINDIEAVDQPVFSSDVVTEILYRGAEHFPTEEVAFLERMGFERNLVRDQYAAVYKDLVPACKYEEVTVRPAVAHQYNGMVVDGLLHGDIVNHIPNRTVHVLRIYLLIYFSHIHVY